MFPEGPTELSPGFQPWESSTKSGRALKKAPDRTSEQGCRIPTRDRPYSWDLVTDLRKTPRLGTLRMGTDPGQSPVGYWSNFKQQVQRSPLGADPVVEGGHRDWGQTPVVDSPNGDRPPAEVPEWPTELSPGFQPWESTKSDAP